MPISETNAARGDKASTATRMTSANPAGAATIRVAGSRRESRREEVASGASRGRTITIVASANVASSRTLGPRNYLVARAGDSRRAIWQLPHGTAIHRCTVKIPYDSLEKLLTQ